MSQTKSQRLPLVLFNGVSEMLGRLGKQPAKFVDSLDAFHEAASKAIGADDFGTGYGEGLQVLAQAYDAEAKLTPFGRMMAQQGIITVLKNRLRARKYCKENPTILKQEIRRPIFILGLPRTGTTALHHLIGADPGVQFLEYWLAAAPQPRPPRAEWEARPEFKQAARDLKTMYYLDPSLKAMHLMTADGPEECRHLLQHQFTDDTFDCNSTIPSYSKWYDRVDMKPTYEQHRDLLKLIGSTSPEKRWVLKYPMHMRAIREIFEVYPDACIVQTHRDPNQVLPSICSLVAGWRGMYERDVDPKAVSQWLLDLWASRMEQMMAFRREKGDAHFFDLQFREVLADPVGAVKRIYTHFGLAYSDTTQSRFEAHSFENPRGKHGAHQYRMEDFGITEKAVHERYAAYIEHFQIEREKPK